jgi:signal transduction histidine kinase
VKLPAGSLLWRITLLHLAAVAVLSVALPLVVRLVLNSTTAGFQHEALTRHEKEIVRSLSRTPAGSWRLQLRPDQKTLYEGAYSGFAFAVLDARGQVLFSSLTGRTALFPEVGDGSGPRFVQRSQGEAVYDGGDFPERVGSELIRVQVAQDLANADVVVDDIVSAFLTRIAWFILPILALLMLTDFIIVRRALSPVRDASAMAETIGPATLSLRLPAERMPREIAPLGRAVNQALDRLEQGFKVQREFTADAAHELRTPLSIHRMRLGGLPEGALKQALERDIDRMARIVGQLLRVAELDTFVLDPEQTVELGDLSSELIEYMAPIALAQDRTLALVDAARPVRVKADRRQLFGALRNLVENALAHTPPGTSVDVEVHGPGMIKVLDRGPGIPEADREVVFRRFWRRDRRRSDGAGLGLSIVWRIVQAHGGSVWVEDRPDGGAAFVIMLKPAAEPAATAEPQGPAPSEADHARAPASQA